MDKTLTGIFRISRFLVKSLTNRKCHNSRTSNDIDVKLGPVTKIDKRNTATSKYLTMNLCRQVMRPSSFFCFMINLEQYRTRILETWYIIFTFSLIEIFYQTKGENKTKKSLKVLFLPKNANFLQKMLKSVKLSGSWKSSALWWWGGLCNPTTLRTILVEASAKQGRSKGRMQTNGWSNRWQQGEGSAHR